MRIAIAVATPYTAEAPAAMSPDVHAGGVTAVEHDEQAPGLQCGDVGGQVRRGNDVRLDPIEV